MFTQKSGSSIQVFVLKSGLFWHSYLGSDGAQSLH